MSVEPAVLTWVLLAFDLFNATGELILNRMFDALERDPPPVVAITSLSLSLC